MILLQGFNFIMIGHSSIHEIILSKSMYASFFCLWTTGQDLRKPPLLLNLPEFKYHSKLIIMVQYSSKYSISKLVYYFSFRFRHLRNDTWSTATCRRSPFTGSPGSWSPWRPPPSSSSSWSWPSFASSLRATNTKVRKNLLIVC